LHSPITHSPLHAFVGWSLAVVENNNPISMKYAVDLIRKPNHMWFHDNHYMVLYGVYCVVFMINWQLGFALLLASFIGIMQDNLVNVVGHRKALIGYRNYDTSDNSQNNFVLGFLGWGQGWHNNHHATPAQYDFGGVRWWELDPCIIFLPLLNSPSK
jgi:stearoyl-CoA desaturase (delta-9 desaturase)